MGRKTPLKNKNHEKFAKEIINTRGNATEAYRRVYPNNEKTTPQSAYLLKNLPKVQDRIHGLLEKEGFTPEFLTKKLKFLADAKKPLVVNNQIHEVDDNSTQLSVVNLGLELYGVKNKQAEGVNLTQVNYNNVNTDKLEEAVDKLNRLTEKVDFDYPTGEIEDGEDYQQQEDHQEETTEE